MAIPLPLLLDASLNSCRVQDPLQLPVFLAVLAKTKAVIMPREGGENDPETEEVLLLEKNLWKPWPRTRTKVKGQQLTVLIL